MTRSKVLAVDVGTFCDWTLMEHAFSKITRHRDVVYLTDQHHTSAAKLPHVMAIFYEPLPGLDDIKLPLANTSKPDGDVLLHHTGQLMAMQRFISIVTRSFEAAVEEHKPVAIVLLYSASFLMFSCRREIFQAIPTFVMYHAPGYPNTTIPWLYDQTYLDPAFKVYKSPAGQSSMKNLERAGRLRNIFGMSREKVLRALQEINHVACWANNSTPPIHAVDGLHVHRIGPLVDSKRLEKAAWRSQTGPGVPPPELIAFMRQGRRRIVLMSFGSFADAPQLSVVLQEIINVLTGAGSYNVVLHDTRDVPVESHDRLHVHSGWLPYEWLVPQCSLVVFTGSACLQNIALYNACPMVFVPLLAEQWFWAQNYKHFTGTPYVKFTHPKRVRGTMHSALRKVRSARVKEYLLSTSRTMRFDDGPGDIGKLITTIIRGKKTIEKSAAPA